MSERILVDPRRWMRGEAGKEGGAWLAELQHAVFTDRQLRLTYRGSGRPQASTVVVDPYGLVSKAGIWYLVADRDGEPRLYRVDRVEDAAVADEAVRRRPGVGLAQVWAALRDNVERLPDEVRVRCRVRRSCLDMLLRIHAANIAVPPVVLDDTWAEMRLAFRAVPAARPLLAFGADVEVLSPPEAREDLAATAAEVVALYGGDGSASGRGAGA